MTDLFKEFSEKGETKFFDIFDIIFCHFVKKYGCGILSYKIEDSFSPKVKILSFYGDGVLECKFLANDPVNMIAPDHVYMILCWEGINYLFGQEPFTLSEIRELVFNGTNNKFKKLIVVQPF